MTAHGEQVIAQNARLVEVDTSSGINAMLNRTPLRPGPLAAPPAGSGLRPVPGDRGLPFIGLGIHTVLYGPAFQIQLLRRHGPVSWWQAFGRRIVAAAGPDAVQDVLLNKDKAFASGWPDVIGPWFDGGLLAMNAPAHLTDRRLMQAAYSDEALSGYVRRMVEDADAAMARWPVGQPFKAVPAIRKLSGQITTRAFLAVPYDEDGRWVMDAVEACIRGETALIRRSLPGTAWRRAHRARGRLAAYLTEALPAARARAGGDFLSVLCGVEGQDGARFTDRQLVDHMLFTLLAAHDTTTSATVATLYFLGKHPEWQQRARAESLAGAPLDMDALDRLHVLDLVIKESIRLVSPSPIAMRVTVKDTDILGHFVPAGHLVSVCTGVNQLLPELWPQPARFDPERFSPQRAEDRVHRLAWAPFGAGAHKCIGMQFGMMKVKATLDNLLRRFEWTFPAGYEAPWRFTSLPAPADGLPIVLRPRREGAHDPGSV
ncbi:cytochrome P450 [Dactylosporangium sp. NPDC005572]|uniref:cytochrome P450 n=1 Tax=Dactylosporangium sp. NPDC005572 TaxID=3156889 RepID=UPI0033B71C7D